MIGNGVIEYLEIRHFQRWRRKYVVDVAIGAPAREGMQHFGRFAEVGQVEQPVHLRAGRSAVEVAHHHHMLVIADNLAQEIELALARAAAEGEVHQDQDQRRVALAEAYHHCAAAGYEAGQLVLRDHRRPEFTQQAVAVLGEAAEIAIGLVSPEREMAAAQWWY